MTKIRLNPEYARRHLFVVLLMLGMGGWFGYDGFVTYPRQTPAELYASCHKGEQAPSEEMARHFAANAIPRQKQFMVLCFVAALIVGLRLGLAARQRVAFDGDGISVGGKSYSYADVKSVDESAWQKKGIVKLTLADRTLVLDAWHHRGVEELYKILKEKKGTQI